jgi:hypothetical protein
MISVLVAGLGNMGLSHAQAYHRNPGYTIVGLMNRSKIDLPQELQGYPVYSEFYQALRESNYPITEIGFDKIFDRLIQLAKDDMASDPTAANTQVSHFRDAKVNDRVCSHLRVVHPAQGKGIMFHEANLYVDNELKVPIRLVVHGWPESEGGEKPLIEEYSYVDLKMNVGLKDADFSEESLGSSPSASRPKTKTSVSLSR